MSSIDIVKRVKRELGLNDWSYDKVRELIIPYIENGVSPSKYMEYGEDKRKVYLLEYLIYRDFRDMFVKQN